MQFLRRVGTSRVRNAHVLLFNHHKSFFTTKTFSSEELYRHISHVKSGKESNYVAVDVRPMKEIIETFGKTIDQYVGDDAASSIKYVHLDDILSSEWLDQDSEDFQEAYSFPHPIDDASAETSIVFICRGGMRSKLAAEVALSQGVKVDLLNYAEGAAGWDEWNRRMQHKEKDKDK